MTYNDLYRQMEHRERQSIYKNNLIAKKLLEDLKVDCVFQYKEELDQLLAYYFSIKNTEIERTCHDLFRANHFNYAESIHNALYYLLATEKEYDFQFNPMAWPGIHHITKWKNQYILATVIGKIEACKADEIFKKSAILIEN